MKRKGQVTSVEVLVIIAIITILTALLVPAIYRAKFTSKAPKNFEKVFGFDIVNVQDPGLRGDREFFQPLIDKRLKELARSWESAITERNDLTLLRQGIINSGVNDLKELDEKTKSLKELDRGINSTMRSIAQLRETFELGQSVAEFYGFTIKKDMKDYLLIAN